MKRVAISEFWHSQLSAILLNVIGNFDDPIPIRSSDWHHFFFLFFFFSVWYGGGQRSLKKLQKQTNKQKKQKNLDIIDDNPQ